MTQQRSPQARNAEEYAIGRLVALRIRAARDAELSQRGLAAATGLSQPTVADIERGNRRVTVLDLWAIARATGWPVERFVGPPADEDEQEEWELCVREFTRGIHERPRNRRGSGRRPRPRRDAP